jgi:SWI/SNF-related matrix-associated actin-dependent regulator of chromatin subfamily A-like protein 1
MLIAYVHNCRNGARHLRVSQSAFTEALKLKLQRIGSPARWIPSENAWDCPLGPSSVTRLAEVAREVGEIVDWKDGLQAYADEHLKQSDYEHEVRMAMERILQAKQQLDPYVTLMNRADGQPCPPLWHQDAGYHWSIRVRGLLLAWEMGCIDGQAVIKIKRHRKVYPTTLADLYRKFHGLDPFRPWKKPGPVTCKSLYDDGTLRHNLIKDVLDKGERDCVEIRLKSGKKLVCTPDHEVRTDSGWVEANKLTTGDTVLTNGKKVRDLKGEANPNWRRGWTLSGDGYRQMSGFHGHPMADHHGQIPEHRLVMATHLGRHLTAEEVVHHRDGDRANNRLENLELMERKEHNRQHGAEHAYRNMDGGTAGTGGEIVLVPRYDTVVSVKAVGKRHVYDIVMEDPARNFAANGVIVHNCGKTRAACDASGGWYRLGQIQPMQPQVIDGKPAVAGGVLVVCPKTMLKTWQEELARWQNAHGVIIAGEAVKKARLAGTPAHYHIVNYEGLKYVTHNRYAGFIADEVHRLANSTNATDNALTIAGRAQKKLGLTGTPIANDLKSIFYPMLVLDGGRALGPSRTAFLEKFFTSSRNMAGFVEHEAKADSATEIARAISTSTYFVKKEDCLDLPPKTHTPIYLTMTPEQLRYYNSVKQEAITYIQDATVTVEQAAARCMKLLQICQGFALTDVGDDEEKGSQGRHFTDAKTEALMEMLTDQLRGRKCVVWTLFKYETRRLVAALEKAGISYLRIDGTVKSQAARDAAKDRWNNDSSVTVFVRQLSMSEGVTLLGTEDMPCYTTVYASLNYSMTNLLQSMDRVHRIGQTRTCDYIYLLTENGIDRQVYNRLLEKVANANAVISVGKAYYRELLTASAA